MADRVILLIDDECPERRSHYGVGSGMSPPSPPMLMIYENHRSRVCPVLRDSLAKQLTRPHSRTPGPCSWYAECPDAR